MTSRFNRAVDRLSTPTVTLSAATTFGLWLTALGILAVSWARPGDTPPWVLGLAAFLQHVAIAMTVFSTVTASAKYVTDRLGQQMDSIYFELAQQQSQGRRGRGDGDHPDGGGHSLRLVD